MNKRENYRRAFDDFYVYKIAHYGEKDINRLLTDSGIIRNRLKIASTIQNAKTFLEIQKEFGTFDAYIWQFVNGKPINHKIKNKRSQQRIILPKPHRQWNPKELLENCLQA